MADCRRQCERIRSSLRTHRRPIHADCSNDLVLIDMWAKLQDHGSVYYDITSTGFCGEPRAEVKQVFAVVSKARNSAIEFVQQSTKAKKEICGFEVDDVARGYIEKEGFGEQFIHRTGHSIGTDVHGAGANMDNFETHDQRRIILGHASLSNPACTCRSSEFAPR